MLKIETSKQIQERLAKTAARIKAGAKEFVKAGYSEKVALELSEVMVETDEHYKRKHRG